MGDRQEEQRYSYRAATDPAYKEQLFQELRTKEAAEVLLKTTLGKQCVL